MMELHGDRDNPHTLWISARAAVANRAWTNTIGQFRLTASQSDRGACDRGHGGDRKTAGSLL